MIRQMYHRAQIQQHESRALGIISKNAVLLSGHKSWMCVPILIVIQINNVVLPAICILPFIHVCATHQQLCTTNHVCTNRHSRVYYKPIMLYYPSSMY